MLTTGYSNRQRLIIVAHTDRDQRIRIISARDVTAAEQRDYAEEGANLVLLEADVAQVFRDSATVNEALRQYLSEHGTPPAVSDKAG